MVYANNELKKFVDEYRADFKRSEIVGMADRIICQIIEQLSELFERDNDAIYSQYIVVYIENIDFQTFNFSIAGIEKTEESVLDESEPIDEENCICTKLELKLLNKLRDALISKGVLDFRVQKVNEFAIWLKF